MHILAFRYADSITRGKCVDFYISGRSLLNKVERLGYKDMIPRLGTEFLPADLETRELLLLQRQDELPKGRVGLYVCPLCADYGCGVVSVKITRDGTDFVWSEFRHENNYESKHEAINNLGPFRFDEEQYRSTIMGGVVV